MMKTGIGTSSYFNMTDSKSGFLKMKEHGYDCADYQNLLDMESDLYKSSDKFFEEFLLGEYENSIAAGIEISQVHAPWPTDDTTPESRALKLEAMKKAIYGTHLLGCKNIVIHPVMPFGWGNSPDPARSKELNLELFTDLLPTAKSNDVYICIENMPMTNLSLSRVEDVAKLIDELNSEYIGMCLDTGHCAVFGDDSGDMVRLAGKRLRVLHVHDNNGKSDLHWIPYNGVINWDSFHDALIEIGFTGPVSLETSVSSAFPPEIKEYMQIGLAKIAKYIAR